MRVVPPGSLTQLALSFVARRRYLIASDGSAQEEKCSFGTFDILTDEEVRQGLKKFSNWPTYPQLYVDGNLVGGLDIVQELKESGDLADTLS